MDSIWVLGVWLGVRFSTTEHLVTFNGKVYRARSIMPCPEGEEWSKTEFDKTEGTPSWPAGIIDIRQGVDEK